MDRVARFVFLCILLLAPAGVSIASDLEDLSGTYREFLDASTAAGGGKRSLSLAEAREDLGVLERLLRTSYSGWEAAREAGVDWDSLLRNLDLLIVSRSRWREADLVKVLVSGLGGIRDRHFGFFEGEGVRARYHPITPELDPYFADLVLTQDAGGILRVVETSRSLASLEKAVLLAVGDGSGTEEAAGFEGFLFRTVEGGGGGPAFLLGRLAGEKPSGLAARFRLSDGSEVRKQLDLHCGRARLSRAGGRVFRSVRIPYPKIELRSLAVQHAQDLAAFVESATSLREEPAILLDLRGNPCGSDRFGREWLSRLTGREFRYWEVRELVSPGTLQGDVLLHEWILASGIPRAARPEIEGRLEYARRRLAEAAQNRLERTWTSTGPAEVGEEANIGAIRSGRGAAGPGPRPGASGEGFFRGRLVLLVDRGTRSSAETLVMSARQLPGTVVAGENTAGTMRFGEVKLYRLPNSGLRVQLGSKRFEDPTGTFEEGRGFLPDYWLDESEDVSVLIDEILAGDL